MLALVNEISRNEKENFPRNSTEVDVFSYIGCNLKLVHAADYIYENANLLKTQK